ncbi:MAG: molybdenum cofactor guanylyltransferase [bacterium]|nr:molybdenum cofactor guanylyltransferase [bacterium]
MTHDSSWNRRAVWPQAPVWSCILIGGKSRRMQCPKQLLPSSGGVTWLERTVAVAVSVTPKVVLAGDGVVASSLTHLPHLPDVPDVEGPLAGLLAAMRWAPRVSWLLLACDLPELTSEALRWVMSYRSPAIRAVLPSIKPNMVEPLAALYEWHLHPLLESRAASGIWGFQSLPEEYDVITPLSPQHLLPAWNNVNTPHEKQDYERAVL